MKSRIGEAGKVSNNSQASASPNFTPPYFRMLYYAAANEDCFALVAYWLAIFLLGIAAIGAKWSIWLGAVIALVSLLPLLVGLLLTYITFVFPKRMQDIFRNGLLTAAMIESVKPVTALHIANISTGQGDRMLYGIIRVKHGRFPSAFAISGSKIPCVSYFEEGNGETWRTFTPTPICFGTEDPERLQRCLEVVADDGPDADNYFGILKAFLSKHKIPKDADKDVFVCDKDGNLIERRRLSIQA